MRRVMTGANDAATLAEISGEELTAWRNALHALTDDMRVTPVIAGAAARLLYEAEALAAEEAATLLSRALSPGRAVVNAAGYFEGFFEGGGDRLIYDKPLREAVDGWMQSLEEERFIEHLPLFRRVFSNLDRMQRRRLLDALFGRAGAGLPGRALRAGAAEIWPRHFARLTEILAARPSND
jgi:hypothetical protein